MSILCVHMQFGPQSAGRLSPLQNCSGLISSYCEMSGAGADRYEISSIREITWSPVGATVSVWWEWCEVRMERECVWYDHTKKCDYALRLVPKAYVKANPINNCINYLRIDCKCSAGTALRRGTDKTGTARKFSHRPYPAARPDRPVLRFSTDWRRLRHLAAGYIARPTDSIPTESPFFFVSRAARYVQELYGHTWRKNVRRSVLRCIACMFYVQSVAFFG